MILKKFIFKQLKTRNMTKKILQLIVVLLLITQGVMAQTVDIDDVTRAPGNIEVPVNMLNYDDIGAITLSIAYDANLMEFTGINNIDPLFTGNWTTSANGSEITIIYVAPNNSGTTISGPAFSLQFSYSGGFTGNLLLRNYCEIANINMGIIPSTFTDGSVTQSAAVGAVSMTNLIESIGNTVDMPVNMFGTGFGAVEAITLLIAYDDMQLSYSGLAHSALSGVVANASNGILTINWVGSAQDFATAPVDVFDIQFVYNGGNGDVEFVSGCEIATTGSVLAADYTDGMVTATPGTATFTISTEVAEPGSTVVVPIVAASFGSIDIGSATLKMGFDNSLLSYVTYSAQQPTTGWVVNANNANGEITMQWSNALGTNYVDDNVVTLSFVYDIDTVGGEAFIEFVGGTVLTDLDLATIPVNLINGAVSNEQFYIVDGQLTYMGDDTRPVGTAGTSTTTVYLKNVADSTVAYTASTDAYGNYTFVDVAAGSYFLDATTDIDATWAYDVTDAYVIYGIGGTLTGLQYLAADVNEDGVDVTDAYIVYGSVTAGNVKVPAWTAPNWFFDGGIFTVSGDVTENFSAICSGDANGDFVPVP